MFDRLVVPVSRSKKELNGIFHPDDQEMVSTLKRWGWQHYANVEQPLRYYFRRQKHYDETTHEEMLEPKPSEEQNEEDSEQEDSGDSDGANNADGFLETP